MPQRIGVSLILALVLLVSSCTPQPPPVQRSPDQSVAGLEQAQSSEFVELENGAVYAMIAEPVAKEIKGNTIRMYAYNGMIPGPVLKVRQGSTVYVNFTNAIGMDTTIHWHGVRLGNAYDGVPGITQQPIRPGETFVYRLNFPDPGIYWYHPHMREDMQQELGLYGNILVEPSDDSYFNPVDLETTLFLDDIKMADHVLAGFDKEYSRFSLMGRFGNIMLTEGQTDYGLTVRRGETVRFYITNAANARPFNVSIKDHRLRLVGGDSGLYEKETMVDAVVLVPGERAIVEVLFDRPGTFPVMHTTPESRYVLGTIDVLNMPAHAILTPLHDSKATLTELEPYRKYITTSPDYILDMTVTMTSMENMHHAMSTGNAGIEWEEGLETMNSMSTSQNTRWILRDKATGKENMDIVYGVDVGDVKKIRLYNDPHSMHPMQHPIHIHGQRFLVLDVDGKPNDNLVWKDTVLVPAGSTVDILVVFTNPGRWMIHCHIAEHLEAGMAAMFDVK